MLNNSFLILSPARLTRLRYPSSMVPYSIPYFILALAPNTYLRPLRKLSAFSSDLSQK
jgi:hypothetical protein